MSNLKNTAMLVNLSMSCLSAHKHDKKVSGEVAAQHSTNVKAGRYNKHLFGGNDPDSLTAIKKIMNEARTDHYAQTLPYSEDGGPRICTNKNYLNYTNIMRKHRNDFQNAVPTFEAEYPSLIALARNELNGLFNSADYPERSKLSELFSFKLSVLPFPDEEHFVVQSLVNDEVELIREQIREDNTSAIATAQLSLYKRLLEAVSRMSERLNHPDAVFRDSLVDNLKELCEVLPRLNLTNDQGLDDLLSKVNDDLCKYEPEVLRVSPTTREATAARAMAIESDLKLILGV